MGGGGKGLRLALVRNCASHAKQKTPLTHLYLHDSEEGFNGSDVIGELFLEVSLHFGLASEDGVLSFLLSQSNLDGVKVLVQLDKLQLAFGDLVKRDAQKAVLMELANVVKSFRRNRDNSV